MTTRSTERDDSTRKASSGAESGWPASVTKTSSAARRQACSASRAWPPSRPPAPGVSTSTTPGSRPGPVRSATPATSGASMPASARRRPPTATQSRIVGTGSDRSVPSTNVTVAWASAWSMSACSSRPAQRISTKTPVVMSAPVGTSSRRPSRAFTSVLLPRFASPTTATTGGPGRARSRLVISSSRSVRSCWRSSKRAPRTASACAAVSRTAAPMRAWAAPARGSVAVTEPPTGLDPPASDPAMVPQRPSSTTPVVHNPPSSHNTVGPLPSIR